MSLIGQMDSPFVRRVAVTMATYDIRFQLKPLSVLTPTEN
jgi:glutathione S-transferase